MPWSVARASRRRPRAAPAMPLAQPDPLRAPPPPARRGASSASRARSSSCRRSGLAQAAAAQPGQGAGVLLDPVSGARRAACRARLTPRSARPSASRPARSGSRASRSSRRCSSSTAGSRRGHALDQELGHLGRGLEGGVGHQVGDRRGRSRGRGRSAPGRAPARWPRRWPGCRRPRGRCASRRRGSAPRSRSAGRRSEDERRDHLALGLLALHRGVDEDHPEAVAALLQAREEVVVGGAAVRGDERDRQRQVRQSGSPRLRSRRPAAASAASVSRRRSSRSPRVKAGSTSRTQSCMRPPGA